LWKACDVGLLNQALGVTEALKALLPLLTPPPPVLTLQRGTFRLGRVREAILLATDINEKDGRACQGSSHS
jgi:hypothetical protein